MWSVSGSCEGLGMLLWIIIPFLIICLISCLVCCRKKESSGEGNTAGETTPPQTPEVRDQPANSDNGGTPGDAAPRDDKDKQVIEFLKYAISYLENRISMVDRKASILIAGLGVFFTLLTYMIQGEFFTLESSDINKSIHIWLGIAFVFFIIDVLLLLQTIRPTKWFFCLELPIIDRYKNNENYVMLHRKYFPAELDDYTNKINKFDLSIIKENYEKTHYITLQLVRMKYKFYNPAVLLTKLLVLWVAIGIIILLSCQYILTCS
ncbi:MAG: hypothetical protein JW878_01050 [Methanomicrobia archaeon]|jgi:hypothetical protein|nr:hypothetical protein [Methanomicrobia archaeon]